MYLHVHDGVQVAYDDACPVCPAQEETDDNPSVVKGEE